LTLTGQVSHSFVRRKEAERGKFSIDLSEVDLRVKKSRFEALLQMLQSFAGLFSVDDESEKTSSAIIDTEALRQTVSVALRSVFRRLKIAVMRDDNSTHTVFDMSNAAFDFRVLRSIFETCWRIGQIQLTSGDREIIKTDSESIFLEFRQKDDIDYSRFVAVGPKFLLDSEWLDEMMDSFHIRKMQPTVKAEAQVLALPTIAVDISISKPKLGLNLNTTIVGVSLTLFKVQVNKSQEGRVDFEDFRIAVGKRSLMPKLSGGVDLTLGKDPSIGFVFDELKVALRPSDWQPLLGLLGKAEGQSRVTLAGTFAIDSRVKRSEFSVIRHCEK
jgi:hypothetical protein